MRNFALALFALALSGCSVTKITPARETGLFQTPSPQSLAPQILITDLTKKSQFGFSWPVKEGQVSSFFGKRRRGFHDGIDIRANRGTPVYAAKAGRVIYSGRRIKGYGNMIVIRHDEEMATVYAHNKKNLVKKGDTVGQGQLLGLVGATGKATGPHLHFEIRKSELPEDPLEYLPPVRGPAAMANK